MGQQMTFLNGGPSQKLSEAFSFFVSCDTQQEIDYYWERLPAGRRRDRSAAGSKTASASAGRSFRENIGELIQHIPRRCKPCWA